MAAKKKSAPTKDDDRQLLLETSSGGGPVLLLPVELAGAWTGARGADYDRACAPEAHVPTKRGGIGSLSVGSGTAIVLSEELPTSWLPTEEGGVVIRGPETSGMIAGAARKALPKTWKPVGTLELFDGRIVLFDAAAAGEPNALAIECDPEPIVVALGAGTYEVTRAHEGHDDFIRLVRTASREATPGDKPVTPPHPPLPPPPEPPDWEIRSLPWDAVITPPGPPVTFDPSTERLVRAEPGKPPVPLSEPGELGQFEPAQGGHHLWLFGGSERILEVPVNGTTRDGVVRYAAKHRISSLSHVDATRAVVAHSRRVHLLDTTVSPWRVLHELELGAQWDPVVRGIDEGPYVWIDADPHIHFAAVKHDRLQLVQSTLRTRGGITCIGRRAFVFGRKLDQQMHHEITNLRAVHDALP